MVQKQKRATETFCDPLTTLDQEIKKKNFFLVVQFLDLEGAGTDFTRSPTFLLDCTRVSVLSVSVISGNVRVSFKASGYGACQCSALLVHRPVAAVSHTASFSRIYLQVKRFG